VAWQIALAVAANMRTCHRALPVRRFDDDVAKVRIGRDMAAGAIGAQVNRGRAAFVIYKRLSRA